MNRIECKVANQNTSFLILQIKTTNYASIFVILFIPKCTYQSNLEITDYCTVNLTILLCNVCLV